MVKKNASIQFFSAALFRLLACIVFHEAAIEE